MTVYTISDVTVPTNLNGGINASTLTIVGNDFSTYPSADFVILIDAEEVDIQSRSGNTLTVRSGGRGYGDTIAASHADDAEVTHVLTNQDLIVMRQVGANVFEAQGVLDMKEFDILGGHDIEIEYPQATGVGRLRAYDASGRRVIQLIAENAAATQEVQFNLYASDDSNATYKDGFYFANSGGSLMSLKDVMLMGVDIAMDGNRITDLDSYYSNHPTSGSITWAWEDDYWRARFGGSATPLGLRIDDYDSAAVYLMRKGQIVARGVTGTGAPDPSGGGVLVVKSSNGAVGDGGAIAFGASQGEFAGIKGYITDGGNNTRGRLDFYTREVNTDTDMSLRMRITEGGEIQANDGSTGLNEIFPYGTLLGVYYDSDSGTDPTTSMANMPASVTVTLDHSSQPVVVLAWGLMRSSAADENEWLAARIVVDGTAGGESRHGIGNVTHSTHSNGGISITNSASGHQHGLTGNVHQHDAAAIAVSDTRISVNTHTRRVFTPSGSSFAITLQAQKSGSPTDSYCDVMALVFRG